jgi:hypothetical protein
MGRIGPFLPHGWARMRRVAARASGRFCDRRASHRSRRVRSAAFVVVTVRQRVEPNVVHALDWNLAPSANVCLVMKETSYLAYKKLLEVARLCADQARASTSKAVAQELWRMSRKYQDRAAKVDKKLPYIEAPSMHGPE